MFIELVPIEIVITLGICSGVVALTITKMKVFEWFRNLVVNLTNLISGKFAEFIDELIHCHYCTGHWSSLLLVILAIEIKGFLHFVITWFSVTAISVLFSSTLDFILEKTK